MSGIVLFVYGTLKRGQPNHHFLEGQEFLGPARTLPRYRLYDSGTNPALVSDPTNGVAVAGELWRVAETALPALDTFEEVPELFDRCEVLFEAVAGPVFAYIYVRDTAGMRACGGNWPR